jgi:putative copper resistance protein D
MIGILITMVALYIKGVMVLTKRGDKWPVSRTISFALGISVIDFATSGGLGLYAHFSFSHHMMAHMLLGMIAPIGLVLGAPITLALRTLPRGVHLRKEVFVEHYWLHFTQSLEFFIQIQSLLY